MLIDLTPWHKPKIIERKIKILSLPDDVKTLFYDSEQYFYDQILSGYFDTDKEAGKRIKELDPYRNKQGKGVFYISKRNKDNVAYIDYMPEKLSQKQLVDFFESMGIKISLL